VTSNSVVRLIVDKVLEHGSQSISERGVIRSREPFIFWGPTLSLERFKLELANFVHIGYVKSP